MYQVILMYGENEPWWFFDDWKEDIVEEKEFSNIIDAKHFFDQTKIQLNKQYAHEKEKPSLLTAFWNDDEMVYCEDCDEDLQAYKGLMLLKNYEKLDNGDLNQDETINHSRKTKCCTRHS